MDTWVDLAARKLQTEGWGTVVKKGKGSGKPKSDHPGARALKAYWAKRRGEVVPEENTPKPVLPLPLKPVDGKALVATVADAQERKIMKAVVKLPPEQRRALELMREGSSYDDMVVALTQEFGLDSADCTRAMQKAGQAFRRMISDPAQTDLLVAAAYHNVQSAGKVVKTILNSDAPSTDPTTILKHRTLQLRASHETRAHLDTTLELVGLSDPRYQKNSRVDVAQITGSEKNQEALRRLLAHKAPPRNVDVLDANDGTDPLTLPRDTEDEDDDD